MIKIAFAREQSSLPELEPIQIKHDWEAIVDEAVVKAYGERKFEALFHYDHELVCFLEQNYRKDGYKIKVLTDSNARDGGYPERVKLSWYPKQHIQGEAHA